MADPVNISPAGDTPGPRRGPLSILAMALWFGLAVGLLELGLMLMFKKIRDPSPGFFRINRHVVWMIPTFNLAAFLAIGLVLALVARKRPRLADRAAVIGFSFLGMLTLLLTYNRLFAWASLFLACGFAFRVSARIKGREAGFGRFVAYTLPVLAVATAALAGTSFYRNVVAARRPASGLPDAGKDRPNVLMIVLDTVRADRLSLYGYERPTSPNLERLAGGGIKFDKARSTAPWTLPSHASMMTGRWPHQLDATINGPLGPTFPTLAEFLASKGYATGGFVANENYTGAETGLARGFSRYEDREVSPLGVMLASSAGNRLIWPLMNIRSSVNHSDALLRRKDAAEVNDQVLGWIDSLDDDRPFFAFLNLFDAHDPYIPPPQFDRKFGIAPETKADRFLFYSWFIKDKKTVTPREVTLINDAYDNCLVYMDEQIGVLLDELKRRGELEKTLIVVTSDHGEHFGEHDLFGHASSLYVQELGVPLVIVPPEGLPKGLSVDPPASLRDLPITIADLLGYESDAPFPGRSLARFWEPAAPTAPEAASNVLSVVEEPVQASPNQGRSPVFRGSMKSLATDEHSYIINGDGVEELYHTESDPLEAENLVGNPDSAPILEGFRDRLRELLEAEPPVGDRTPAPRKAKAQSSAARSSSSVRR